MEDFWGLIANIRGEVLPGARLRLVQRVGPLCMPAVLRAFKHLQRFWA